jgi:hypothetical protein
LMANGIDFVIGGRDQAKPAMSSVERGLSRLEKKTNSVKNATLGLMAAMGPLIAVFAAVRTAMALKAGIEDANAAYDTQTEAVKGLEVALRLQGAAVDVESKRLQAFASDMQKLTGIGDESTIAMMQRAAMMGVATDQLDDMAKAGIGLGEVMGTSAESGMESMRRATEGNFQQFERTFPAMRQMATDAEKLAFLSEMAAKGLTAKAEAGDRVAGMGQRASGAVGDLMESVGALLAPVRMLISSGIKTLAESLQTLLVPAVAYAEEVLANIGPLMDYVKGKVIAAVNGIVAAFTFFEVILTNLDSVWAIVVAQAELYMLQISGVVMHALTEVIPAYAAWFGENFVNLIRDGLNLAYTITVNRIAKIVDALAALWDFIASGGSSDVLGQLGEIAGRSYLEGFESSLTSLPDVAGRAISEREKELAGTVTRIATDLGDQFSKKFAERMIGVSDGLSDDFDSSIDLKSAGLLGAGGGGKSGDANLSAKESRLLSRGPGMRPEDLLDQIRTVLEDIRSNTKGTTRMVPQI